MLEEILLFCSTYSEQLLLDATLIGSAEPIQPCRDAESQLCSLQDTHHWQSNSSEYRQYPPPPAHPRVVFWAKIGASSGTVGGSLWEVPVQEWIYSCQNAPQIPQENALEGRGVQRQLVPPWALRSRQWWYNQRWGRGRCHRWGGHPVAQVFMTAVPTWAGARPSTAPLLLQVAQGKPGARQNRGQVWDVLWSSCHLSPITTQLRAREEQLSPCTYTVHQTYQRSNVTATPVNKVGQSQPWGTQEPSHQL